jgi:hypothetical protein
MADPKAPTMTTTTTTSLDVAGLEDVYDCLAGALDRAPQGRSELVLVKLALLLAGELGDARRFAQLAELALQDLQELT